MPEAFVRLAPEDAPACVLGLDGSGIKDSSATHNLTLALRKAFANRGLSGGEEITLEEMRLTMGCSNDEVACLAEGGKTLGVRRLVFGYLRKASGGYELDLQILDVDTGRLEAQGTVSVTKSDLSSANIDAKAAAIVNELMPAEQTDSDLPPRPDPLPDTSTDPDPDPDPEEPRKPKEGGIWFGIEKPTPKWKWAAFGTSLGITLAAAGTTIVTGVWLTAPDSASFGFRPKLIETGRSTAIEGVADPGTLATRDDNNGAFFEVNPDDLPPYVDICHYNTHEYTKSSGNVYTAGDPLVLNGEDRSRNGEVAKVCTSGQDIRKLQIASGVTAAVFGVATLAFLGVLLLHKRKPATEAMRRRGFRLGVAPRLDGQRGMSVSGGLRF